MKGLDKYLPYILLVAVLVLYIMHFSSETESTPEVPVEDSVLVDSPKEKTGRIYYVNTDSIWENYTQVQEITSMLEGRKTQFENQIQREVRNFEQEVADFRSKGATMSQVELEIKQRDLMRKESELGKMSEELELKFMTEEKEWNDKLRKSIIKYIEKTMENRPFDYVLGYSTQSAIILANDSLDLTAEVTSGLNAEYKAKQAEEKK